MVNFALLFQHYCGLIYTLLVFNCRELGFVPLKYMIFGHKQRFCFVLIEDTEDNDFVLFLSVSCYCLSPDTNLFKLNATK